MRREAGHAFIANPIWQIGLPDVPHFDTKQAQSSATEQRQDMELSAQDLEALPMGYSECVGMAGSRCRCASPTPRNAGVPRSIAKNQELNMVKQVSLLQSKRPEQETVKQNLTCASLKSLREPGNLER